MNKEYDWMVAGNHYPKLDAVLKVLGLARYGVVKSLENDIELLSGTMHRSFTNITSTANLSQCKTLKS